MNQKRNKKNKWNLLLCLLMLPMAACGALAGLTGGDLSYSVVFENHQDLRIAEGSAGETTYNVRLSDKPAARVSINIDPGSEAEVLPALITFGPADWKIPKPVQVTAVDDTKIEGDHGAVLEHTITSDDPNFADAAPAPVNVLVSDNDSPGFYLFPAGNLTIDEGDSQGKSYSVLLTHEPAADVVIQLEIAGGHQITSSHNQVVFPSYAWDEPQQITITAVDDLAIEAPSGNQAVITHTVFSSDAAFQALAPQTLAIAITDNDSVLYVDGRLPVNGDGTGWSSAYNDLQTALGNAIPGQEIWVAESTYLPGAPGDRAAGFVMVDGVNIYGGFSGVETARSQADPATNKTILSCDLEDNDNDPVISDNCYRVVTAVNVGTETTLRLEGFIIQGGNADDATIDHGAGIYISNSDISLNALVVRNNNVTDDAGGIYAVNSTIAIENSEFTNNEAIDRGGAFYSYNSVALTIIASSFDANQSGNDGGAMVINHSTSRAAVYLNGLTITNNTAVDISGGIYLNDADNSLIRQTHFGTNPTNGNSSTDNGGGMTVIGAAGIEFEDTSFIGNSSSDKGGGLHLSNTTGAVIRSTAGGTSLFQENHATGSTGGSVEAENSGSGGAVVLKDGTSDLTIDGVSFLGNTATGTAFAAGGAVYANGVTGGDALTIIDSTFTGNQAQGDGGAVYGVNLGADIASSSFNGNSGAYGGAIRSEDNESLGIVDSQFDSNTANQEGGAIYAHHQGSTGDGSVIIETTSFTNNQAITEAAGALHLSYADNSILQSVGFGTTYTIDGDGLVLTRDGNTSEGVGGAMYMAQVDGIKFIDSHFRANKSFDRGGGLYFNTCTGVEIYSTQPETERASFAYNFTEGSTGTGITIAHSGAAGALYGYNGASDLTIKSVDFTGNRAAGTTYAAGGAVYFRADNTNDKLLIEDSRFEKNTSVGRGGAMYIYNAPRFNILRTTYKENEGLHGGALQLLSSNSPNIFGSQFILNEATGGHGGAIHSVGDDSLEVASCLFYGNHAVNYGGAFSTDDEGGGSTADAYAFSNSTFVDNTAGDGGGTFGIDAPNTTLNLYNSILYNNTAAGSANHIQQDSGSVNQTNNVELDLGDPIVFLNDSDDPAAFDFRLDPADPTIATYLGTSDETKVESNEGFLFDLDGNARTFTGTGDPGTDLGAYEVGKAGVKTTPRHLVTDENGTSASFDVVLTGAPGADVVINISSCYPAEVVADTTSLTFPAADWDTPRTVQVTGVADSTADGDHVDCIELEPVLSSDANYNGYDPLDVIVTNVDVD